MNEYQRELYEDLKKYMPFGKNGKMWTTGIWSERHVWDDHELEFWSTWFNSLLVTGGNQGFNPDFLENKLEIFRRLLPDVLSVGSLLLYIPDSPFPWDEVLFCRMIREILEKNEKLLNGVWFYGNHSNSEAYYVMDFGPFTFKDLFSLSPHVQYPANLGPVTLNLINDHKGQEYDDSLQLFGGVVGENRDWMLMILLTKAESLEITFSGDLQLCNDMREAFMVKPD